MFTSLLIDAIFNIALPHKWPTGVKDGRYHLKTIDEPKVA